jgi:hypothetical protein
MPGASGARPTNRFIPVKWASSSTDRVLYEGVVKPSGRSCHMTSSKKELDFDDASEFSGGVACSKVHRMPHAEQALRRFWNSGARAYLSQRYRLATVADGGPGSDCSAE